MSQWRLGWRTAWRQWRSRSLQLLFISLMLAVAVDFSVQAFSRSVYLGMTAQSAGQLGGDAVVSSGSEIPAEWGLQAQSMGLQFSQSVVFTSMVYYGDDNALVAIKAVDSNYPLLGQVAVKATASHSALLRSGPRVGELWVEPRLQTQLNSPEDAELEVGDVMMLQTGQLVKEPDRTASWYDVSARLMMHRDDLAQTNLLQPTSRARYRLALVGAPRQIEAYGRWLQPHLQTGQHWRQVGEGSGALARTLQTAKRYLNLAIAMAALLAAAAVAMAARHYAELHRDEVAILKSFGAVSSDINQLHLGRLSAVVLAAVSMGWLLGGGLYLLMGAWLQPMATTALAPLGLDWLWLMGLSGLLALVCVAGFALPPILRLRNISPLRLLQQSDAERGQAIWWPLLGVLLGSWGLLWIHAWDLQLTTLTWLGLLVLLLSLTLIGALLWQLVTRFQWRGPRRLALGSIRRRWRHSVVLLTVFALHTLAVAVLVMTRTSLIESWQAQQPADAPNHFLMNVAAYEQPQIESWLQQRQLQSAGFFPVVRGRLMQVNGERVQQRYDESVEGTQRELNLTWAQDIPEANKLIAGTWWPDVIEKPLVSVEAGFAKRLQLELGDLLTFQLGAREFSAEVYSIRELRWDSMRPNFYLLFDPQVLAQDSFRLLSSIYIPSQHKDDFDQLMRGMPTVTVIDVAQIIQRIRSVIDQVALALEWVMALVLSCGLLVLTAAIIISMDQRIQESGLLRALGATKVQLSQSVLLEFALLSLGAALSGLLGAELSAYFVQWKLLNLEPQWHFYLWPPIALAMVLSVTLLGFWACRRALATTPMVALRQPG